VTDGARRDAHSRNFMGGSGELHPERWKDAPVVEHDVMRDGANVPLLLERWGNGGSVADCFPPGLPAALAEVRRLRASWAKRYPSCDFAPELAKWMELKIREEYAPSVRLSRNLRLRRTTLRRRPARPAPRGGA
jgi:hypothetical protein